MPRDGLEVPSNPQRIPPSLTLLLVQWSHQQLYRREDSVSRSLTTSSSVSAYRSRRPSISIHTHRDYVSMFVHHCPAMNCAAYYPKTPRVQACTCSASLIEHMPVVNAYRSPATLSYGADALHSYVNAFTGDATNIPFTPVPMSVPSTNDATSYSYGEILALAPHPVIQTAVMSQLDAHSHSGVENFYGVQHQGSVNVQDSSARFREDYPATYSTAHGAEAWAGQLG
ncbi:hypothetical protein EV421DRAFT_1734773 [Armillaria borealis]|uniref:Uncharacterized protein n=1 Tax=Armillaria borealis TaxID=47425 RepID=A0AA39JQE9_9AGAR|nr:hypothetical protein EV421DRAFT_1734773 [Armillaria borealis]